MSVGILDCRIVLDEPDKIHYGPGSIITGFVAAKYILGKHSKTQANTSTNGSIPALFGPLQVQLILQGALKFSHNQGNDIGVTVHDGDCFLKTQQTIYDSSFQAELNTTTNLPFRVEFPQSLDPKTETRLECYRDDEGTWHTNNETSILAGEKLPPSSTAPQHVHKEHGQVEIEYTVFAQVSMPGIDITIDDHHRVQVAYENDRLLDRPMAATLQINNRINLIGARASSSSTELKGLREKARAMLHSVTSTPPDIAFEILCSGIPNEICLGDRISCELGVRQISDSEPVTVTENEKEKRGEKSEYSVEPLTPLPEVRLHMLKAQIIQLTSTHPSSQKTGLTRPDDLRIVQTLTSDPAILVSTNSFPSSHDLTPVITKEVLNGMSSSFTLGSLTRSYKLRLELEIECEGQTRSVRRDFPLVIHPPIIPDDERLAGITQQTLLMQSPTSPDLNDGLPTYGEAIREPLPPPLDEPPA